MRRIRLFLCYLGALTLIAAFASCSDDKNEEGGGGGGEEIVVPTKGVSLEAFYKGDYYSAGTGNLWINFKSDMQFDEDTRDYIGPGYLLCLDFNTALAENADFAKLAEGVYTADKTDTYAAFTLNVADGDSYITFYEADGFSEMKEITAGTVTVTIEQDYYHLEAALKLEDDTDYPYSFIGKLTAYNRVEGEGKMSNLTGDVTISELSQALVIYYGEAFTSTSDLYTVVLAGSEYNLGINYGASDAMMISVNVLPGKSDGIPTGIYPLIDVATADDYPIYTALSGLFDFTYSGYYGSWFFSTVNQLESSMLEGGVVIVNLGNNNYSFTFSMKDGYGHKVEGFYQGACRMEDAS